MQTEKEKRVTILDLLGLLIVAMGASIISFGMKFITNERIQNELYTKIKAELDD